MNEAKYEELRDAVTALQDKGLAPQKSEQLLAEEQAEQAEQSNTSKLDLLKLKVKEVKEKLSPDYLKSKAQEILQDEVAKLKGTAKGVPKILLAKVVQEFEATYAHLLESDSSLEKYLQNFLFVFSTTLASILKLENTFDSLLVVSVVGGISGFAIGSTMSYKFSKLIDRLKK